jgi:hypothetical protein
MPAILVSYRRDDSKWITGRIVDRLKQHYGRDNVFMDIDAIPVGRDFREHLRNTLDRCDVLLAIVGPRWLVADKAGRPRILDAADWVRIEIETALTKKIPVIPVLIDDAGMPRPDELPETLQDFAYRQAAVIDTDRDFHTHVDRLIQGITGLATQARQSPPQPVVDNDVSSKPPRDTFDALEALIARATTAVEVAKAEPPALRAPAPEVAKVEPPAPRAPPPPIDKAASGSVQSAPAVVNEAVAVLTPSRSSVPQRPPRRQWPLWVAGVGLGLAVLVGSAVLSDWPSTSTSPSQPPVEIASPPEIVSPPSPPPARTKITDRFEPSSEQNQRQPTAAVTPGAAVAQRVVLYEEDPADQQGKRYAGSAIWRTETVSPGPGQSPELAVRADVEIPERRMLMTWSLRRNSDPNLPASHTVEIMFKLPPDFFGGGIKEAPGVLMKQSEQARGTALAGLAVKVTSGFFLIGLSAADTDRDRNLQLLKERAWFDIPIVYDNNRRGIIALEKGTPGERAFADAFRAWRQ